MTARIMTRGEESGVECLIKNMVIKLILLQKHIGRRLEPTVHWKGSCDGLKNQQACVMKDDEKKQPD